MYFSMYVFRQQATRQNSEMTGNEHSPNLISYAINFFGSEIFDSKYYSKTFEFGHIFKGILAPFKPKKQS